jgi:hypothetical protein
VHLELTSVLVSFIHIYFSDPQGKEKWSLVAAAAALLLPLIGSWWSPMLKDQPFHLCYLFLLWLIFKCHDAYHQQNYT